MIYDFDLRTTMIVTFHQSSGNTKPYLNHYQKTNANSDPHLEEAHNDMYAPVRSFRGSACPIYTSSRQGQWRFSLAGRKSTGAWCVLDEVAYPRPRLIYSRSDAFHSIAANGGKSKPRDSTWFERSGYNQKIYMPTSGGGISEWFSFIHLIFFIIHLRYLPFGKSSFLVWISLLCHDSNRSSFHPSHNYTSSLAFLHSTSTQSVFTLPINVN